MSIGARFGSFALLLGLFVGTGALAEDAAPSAWTEPPVRGAAGPQAPDAAKPSTDAPAKPAAEAPAPAKIDENTAALDRAATAPVAKSESEAETKPVRRSAKLRRAQIRREATRARVIAEAPVRRRHARFYEDDTPRYRSRRQAFAEPRLARRTDAARASSVPPRARYGWRSEPPVSQGDAPSYGSPYRTRRAGWGGLLGDSRERRIAEARASGYIVMRSRTFAYPDGMTLRSLMPYEPDSLD